MTFVKGQSGNPGGRKKRDWSWATDFAIAAEKFDKKTGRTFHEIIAEKVIEEAAKGNMLALKEVTNRMDGMPQQDVNLAGKIEQIVITRDSQLLHTDIPSN